MNWKWLLVISLAWGSANAAPQQVDASPEQERLTETLPERGFDTDLHNMSKSVATNTSDVINTAMSMIGVPYKFGGSSAKSGFDCSGFVRAIYQETVGHLLPRKAHDQAKSTEKIDKKELRPGDLVFFNTMRRAFSHVGIYVGNGEFIHAPSRGKGVRVENMDNSYWSKRFNGARRVAMTTEEHVIKLSISDAQNP